MTHEGRDHEGDVALGRAVTASARATAPVSAVVRARLLDRLDRVDPVGVLRAPAGFGRTTLARQWADRQRAQGHVVAWVAGERWGHGGAWAAVQTALTGALQDAGVAPVPGDLAGAVAAAGRPVVLVVDDADEMGSRDDARALADLVVAAPQLRVLLVSGSRHLLLPGGVARHPVVEALPSRTPPLTVTARDLAFTEAELRDALTSWGVALDEARFAELRRLTDGWVGLARVVLDDTRPDDVHLATARGYAYLRDVVLPAVADDELLRQATVVVQSPRPTPQTVRLALDAAGWRSGTVDEIELMLRLEAVGVLQRDRPDAGPSRWSVPELLAEVLRRELPRRDPEAAARVHTVLGRAALHAQPPDVRGAVLHAAQARDWTLLEACALDLGSYLVAVGGAEVEAVYAAVPDDVVAGSTVLGMARSLARRRRDNRTDTRESVLRLMTELGSTALDGRWRSRTATGRWTGAAAALVAARARGDMRRARVVMRDTEVAAARSGVGGSTSSRSYWWFLVQAGRTALLDDDLGAALELPTRAYELADPARAPDVVAAAAAHVALVHALTGNDAEADRWLARHAEALDPLWEGAIRDTAADVAEAMLATDRLQRATAETVLARLDLDLQSPDVTWPFLLRARVRHAVLFGHAESGFADLELVERTHHAWLSQPGIVHRMTLRLRTELLLANGELHRAADLLEEPDPDGVWNDVPRTRWHLLTGDPHAALRAAVVGGRRRRVTLADRLDLLVLEAWAAHDAQQPALAARAFRSARRLAAEQDALRPFAHVPPEVLTALVDATGLPFDEHERTRLASVDEVVPESAELVPLTPRERTVLSMLDRYATTREVADALVVSVNTVRKQVLSIYAKLGVHDRESALRRGHELGLLGADVEQ